MSNTPTPKERTDTRSPDELVREMNEKAEAEIRELEQSAETRVREIEERSATACERMQSEALAEVTAGMKAERDRVIGEVLTSSRAELLAIKRAAVHAALDRAAAVIESRIGGEEYPDALAHLILEGLAFVGGGAVVTIAEEDLALCKEVVSSRGLDCTLSTGAERRGDVLVEGSDGRRRARNGLRVRLDRAAENSVAVAARCLFE